MSCEFSFWRSDKNDVETVRRHGYSRRLRRHGTLLLGGLALIAAGSAPAWPAQGAATATISAPLAAGDEPTVVTQHRIETAQGVLNYEARAGRIAIRNEETGEIRGRIFFGFLHRAFQRSAAANSLRLERRPDCTVKPHQRGGIRSPPPDQPGYG